MTSGITAQTAADPLLCEEFSYGTGPPTGIRLLRYRTAETAGFGACRDDYLHQLYWCRDGQLHVTDIDGHTTVINPDQAYWVQRANTHTVVAVGSTTVYRVCLRQVPRGLVGLRRGAVSITDDACRQVVRLASPSLPSGAWSIARAQVMDGLNAPDVAGIGSTSVATLVAAFLEEHPDTHRSLEDFAAEHHVSAKTLQRDFKRTFECTFSQWRTRVRLAAARDLVGVSTVAEIAHRVGYSTPSAFVAAFTRRYGCTPGSLASTG